MSDRPTYASIRPLAQTGDVFMVQGKSIVSRLIRHFTGEKISHIGMLVWLGGGLFIAEFKEFKGFRLLPASAWIEDCNEDGSNVYFGQAPSSVSDDPQAMLDSVFKYRNQPYGYLSLFKILLSQMLGKNIKMRRLVCSTFVQTMWQTEGFEFERNADPGDFMELCSYINRIEG